LLTKAASTRCAIPRESIEFDLQLPSHVPTPETIDEVEWINPLEGFQRQFVSMFEDSGKDLHVINRPIKYAPNFETPPSSPIASSKKTLKVSALDDRSPTLGPDYWNAKRSSLSPMGTSSVDSSISSRLSTSADSLDGSNHSSEPITQDQLIKEAITRRKRKSQKTASSKRDDSPTPPSREVDAARDTTNKPTVPILAVITNTITNTDTNAQSPQQHVDWSGHAYRIYYSVQCL